MALAWVGFEVEGEEARLAGELVRARVEEKLLGVLVHLRVLSSMETNSQRQV